MHKNFTFTPVPIPERSKSAQIAPITSQQIPTNLQNASITRSATPNDVNNTRPPPLHPKLAAALGDARPITGSLELSTPPTAPQSPSSAACSAYSLPRLPSSSPSPPGQPRQLRNRLVPFQSPSLARRSAPRPAFTDRPPRRPARAPSIGSLSEEEETLEIQPLVARPHRIADHNRLHTTDVLHWTFFLSHALHNALNTIYPLTTASSSSPICPRSTSQSLHPSSGRSISYSSRSAPTLSPALPKTPSSPSSPFQSSASNQQRAYSPKAEDWRQITWTASLTRPDPNRITGHHRKATQSPTSADSSPRDALAPPRTWSGETPRFWT